MITVDVTTLERELRALWKSDEGEGSKPVMTRACTLNLIACAPNARAADQMAETIQSLTASSPNRTVMVIADAAAVEPQIEAWVQANCVLAAPGVPQVCGEQITIDARGTAVNQATSLVLSLLLPDVPVVLWVPGPNPLSSPLVARLRGVADRLILDSADFSDTTAGLATMATLSDQLHAQIHWVGLSDLSWARLTPWRELVAQFFDTRPLLAHLHRLDQVEIEYIALEPTKEVQPGALLLASWLAASLGWVFVGSERTAEALELRFDRPAVGTPPGKRRSVTMVLRPVVGDQPGVIAAIQMRCLDNVRAEFSVERTADPTYAHTQARVDGLATVSRLARLGTLDLANLLGGELRLLSHDRTFSTALGLAGTITAAIR